MFFLKDYFLINEDQFLFLRLFACFLSAFGIVFFSGNAFIKAMIKWNLSQTVRSYGPQTHLSKSGTPTMGGLLILFAILLASVLFSDITNPYVLAFFFITISFGVIGFYDDYVKSKKNRSGLSSKLKFCLQSLTAVIFLIILNFFNEAFSFKSIISLPFFKSVVLDIGFLYLFLIWLVLVGSSNAVNLTDGLDGLAASIVGIVALGFTAFAYFLGDINFTITKGLLYLSYSHELSILAAAVAGACFAFLRFNFYPARIFMGDVGSLALGAILGYFAICLHIELLYFLVGFIFVFETLSVIIQVASYRYRNKKRVFLMAPFHHHLEKKNWSEKQIVALFSLLTLIFTILGGLILWI